MTVIVITISLVPYNTRATRMPALRSICFGWYSLRTTSRGAVYRVCVKSKQASGPYLLCLLKITRRACYSMP